MQPSVAFIGGVDVSHACLEAMGATGIAPSLVVGYDHSRAGASGFVDLGPVCRELGAPLIRAADANHEDVVSALRRVQPDVILVIGWSQLVKAPVLAIPRYGCVGIHPTPLPVGRGRAPIPWTILKGYSTTASTMFFLTEGVDDGDIIGRADFPLGSREDATSLYAKHRAAHVDLVRTYLPLLVEGRAPRHPQDERAATYWPARRPEDGRISPEATMLEADRLVRAVTRPFPGAFVPYGEGRLTIWRAEPADVRPEPGAAGTIHETAGQAFLLCTDGALRIIDAERA